VLKVILENYSNIRTLHLLITPQIPLKSIIGLVTGTKVSELLDPELLALPIIPEPIKRDIPLSYISPPMLQMILLKCGGNLSQNGPGSASF